jgi:hypothetical protein
MLAAKNFMYNIPLAKQLIGSVDGIDFPIFQHHQIIRETSGEIEIVDSHNIELMLHIQIRSGLVRKQDRRLLGQGAGNEHLLHLPA